MGGKSSTTKTTQENKPPSWSEGLFRQSADEASRLYNSGAGGNTYMGPTVSPLSGTTMQGVNQLANAGQNWDTSGTRGLYGQIGAAATSNPFMNKLAGAASDVSSQNVSGADYRGILNRAQRPTSASSNLQGYASGANLNGEGNPFYRQRMEGDLDDTASQVRSLMSGMGRSGSGAETRELTDRLGQMRLEGLENDWNREQANQFNAVGMIDAANQGALGTQLGAAGGIAGINTGNADRALNAAGLRGNMLSSAGQMYGTGIGQAQGAADSMSGIDQRNFENRLAGAGATLQAGGIMDQQRQAQMADEIAKFYALDNQDWSRLAMLQGAAAGSAGNYGEQLATSRQPVSPAGSIGAAGSLFDGIGSMFRGKSDRRLKSDIVLVGAVESIPVYEFSYTGQPDRWRGVIAQELPLHRHDAIEMEGDGFFAVHYDRLPVAMERVH